VNESFGVNNGVSVGGKRSCELCLYRWCAAPRSRRRARHAQGTNLVGRTQEIRHAVKVYNLPERLGNCRVPDPSTSRSFPWTEVPAPRTARQSEAGSDRE